MTAPFLLELAADPQLPERHELVALVTHLATDPADLWWQLNVPVDQDEDPWMDRRLLTTWLPHVHGWLACYDAVRAGVALFQQLLGDARTRAQAAYALAWFPEHADHSIPALTGAVDGEQEPVVAATILVAVGLLADPADGQVQALLDEQLGDTADWRRWGAAIALAVQRAAFPDGPPGAPPRADQLTALQRQAVAVLIEAPDAGRLGNTVSVIASYRPTHLLPDPTTRL